MFRSRTVALLLLLCLPILRAAESVAPEATSFEQTRARIDALLQRRDSIPLLPVVPRNPFSRPSERLPAGADPSAAANSAKATALSDHDLLERLAPTVQVRGILEKDGRPAIIIGRKPFGEGDTLPITFGASTLEVRIERITNDTFTLGYKDAELTLRLPR
ncbi:MAG TPA: hypothetical protein VLW52_16600 [Opitutaceae bacterium]|nr:hypothetical protein [Opitutaceae bacterium]